MRDTRTGADRQKRIKGVVDKTGKKGMPAPDRSGKPEKKVPQGPAARAAEARKELRREEKGKPAAPGAKTTNSRPAPKKVPQGPAGRAAEARKELRKEGKGNAPREQAAPRKPAPPKREAPARRPVSKAAPTAATPPSQNPPRLPGEGVYRGPKAGAAPRQRQVRGRRNAPRAVGPTGPAPTPAQIPTPTADYSLGLPGYRM